MSCPYASFHGLTAAATSALDENAHEARLQALQLDRIADELEEIAFQCVIASDQAADAADTCRTGAGAAREWLDRHGHHPATVATPEALLDGISWGSRGDRDAALRTLRAIDGCPDPQAVRRLVEAVQLAGRRQVELLERHEARLAGEMGRAA